MRNSPYISPKVPISSILDDKMSVERLCRIHCHQCETENRCHFLSPLGARQLPAGAVTPSLLCDTGGFSGWLGDDRYAALCHCS